MTFHRLGDAAVGMEVGKNQDSRAVLSLRVETRLAASPVAQNLGRATETRQAASLRTCLRAKVDSLRRAIQQIPQHGDLRLDARAQRRIHIRREVWRMIRRQRSL